MRIAYDRAGDILVVDLGPLSESPGAEELAPGVYMDRTDEGKVLALEIVNASRFYSREQLEALSPAAAGPRGLVEASVIAGVTPIALRKAIERGKLNASKVGRDWLVNDEDLAAYMADRRRGRPSAAGAQPAPARKAPRRGVSSSAIAESAAGTTAKAPRPRSTKKPIA